MKLVLDVETTVFQKGNPFSRRNSLVVVGVKQVTRNNSSLYWERDGFSLEGTSLLIGFNIKFDLHWIRREGIEIPKDVRIWDCQLAHFILTGQKFKYPSLNDVAEYYGLGQKIDTIKLKYWDNDIDTDAIPKDELEEYLNQDLFLTEQVYLKQLEHFSREDPNMIRLFSLHCQDLLVLEEMEFNGMYFDVKDAASMLIKEEGDIAEIDQILQKSFPDIPINWDSRDHVSCCLYGGVITIEDRVPIGIYKTGIKTGQTRYKLIETNYETPQMVKPLRGSELKKPGYYATDEPTLKSIRGGKSTKQFIDYLLRRSAKNKLCGTYYRGIPELIERMDWPESRIHGQFNQCVAATGRLSSSKPNLQNFDGEVDYLIKSEYE